MIICNLLPGIIIHIERMMIIICKEIIIMKQVEITMVLISNLLTVISQVEIMMKTSI